MAQSSPSGDLRAPELSKIWKRRKAAAGACEQERRPVRATTSTGRLPLLAQILLTFMATGIAVDALAQATGAVREACRSG